MSLLTQHPYDVLCETNVMESSCTFAWKINKFSSRTEKTGEDFMSEEFTIQGPGKITSRWKVKVYPRGVTTETSDFVSVFLYNNSGEDVNARFTLSVLDASNVKQTFLNIMEAKIFTADGNQSNWGLQKCVERTSLTQYTPDDRLTLIFEVTVIGDVENSIEYINNKKIKEEENTVLTPLFHYKKLVEDFESNLNLREHSDVTVTCDNKEFQCHKIILTSRSPVFKTMLESNMKEKETGSIEIKDMQLEVFEDLLKYIYSGEAPNIDEHAEELFAAADLYQLEYLKELCEIKLCAGIDITNCLDLLVISELHHASTLKATALKFLSKNLQSINSSDWKKSLIAYPILFAEVVEMMISNSNTENEKKRTAFS